MNNHNFTGNRYQAAEILQVSDDKYSIFVCNLQPAQFLSPATCNLLNTLKGGHL